MGAWGARSLLFILRDNSNVVHVGEYATSTTSCPPAMCISESATHTIWNVASPNSLKCGDGVPKLARSGFQGSTCSIPPTQ